MTEHVTKDLTDSQNRDLWFTLPPQRSLLVSWLFSAIPIPILKFPIFYSSSSYCIFLSSFFSRFCLLLTIVIPFKRFFCLFVCLFVLFVEKSIVQRAATTILVREKCDQNAVHAIQILSCIDCRD